MKRPDFTSFFSGREALLIFGFLALIRLPLLTGELNLFDRYNIEKDPVLDSRAEVVEAFYFGSPMSSLEARFRPLTAASLAADLSLQGGKMLLVRLANILLHLALTVLMMRLLMQFGVTIFPAATATALVWLHPMQVSSLASLDGRAPLLGMVAYFLAIDLLNRESQKRRHEVFALLFAFLGSLCSVQLVTLAFLPICAAWAHRRNMPAAWRRGRSLLVGSGLGLVLGLVFLGQLGMAAEGRAVDGQGLGGVLRSSFAVIGSSYGRMLVSMRSPAADSPMPGAEQLGMPFAILGFLMVAASLLLGLKARQQNRGLKALGFLMIPLLLLPLTPICGNGPLPTPAEFMPVLAMFAFPLASFLMVPLLSPSPMRRLVVGLILLSLGAFSVLRAWPYRHPEILLHAVVGDGPLSAIAQAEATAASASGMGPAREAERETIESALERFPGEPRLLIERVRVELKPSGRPNLAEPALKKLQVDDRKFPGLSGMAGALAAASGNYAAAKELWQSGWAEEPQDSYSCYSLAQIDMRGGQMAAARAKLLQAIRNLRSPSDQSLALRVLLQLDYLRQRGDMDASTLKALAEEQLRFAARPEDRSAFLALIEQLRQLLIAS